MIRVALVDDQMLVRQGIRSLLELSGDIGVVAEAADGEEALGAIASTRRGRRPARRAHAPAVGHRRPARAARSRPRLPTILLTTFSDDSVALEGVRAGARGFLLKDVTPRTAHAGRAHGGRAAAR